MSIVQGTLPVGSLDHTITLNVQSSGGSHFETVTDTTPYLHRASPQDVASSMKLKKVVGGTIAWNQQIYNGNFADATGWERITGATVSISNNECVATITGNFGGLRIATSLSADYKPLIISGHKYLISAQIKASAQRTNCVGLGLSDNSSHYPIRKVFSVGTSYSDYAFIGTQTDGNPDQSTSSFMVYDTKGSNGVTLYAKNIIAIDLTLMFGSTIADYIYSLEQAHAGDGVAWFKALFPKAYYPYNAGELMSVKTSAHKTVGFNQWDEEWENGFYSRDTGAKAGNSNTTYYRSKNYIPCFPSTAYYIKIPLVHASNNTFCGICYYDANKNFISATTKGSSVIITTPSDAYYMTFYIEVGTSGASYQNDICINFSSSRNGEYEPYVVHSYPLDSDLELRGIPKLDADHKLYYDGDTYASDGNVQRRYGIVDLGSLTWNPLTTAIAGKSRFGASVPNSVTSDTDGIKTIISNGLAVLVAGGTFTGSTDGYTIASTGNIYIFVDSLSTGKASAFKSAMSGVYLVYELATSTTESADAYTQSQRVGATEVFVDGRTVEIPVGNVSEYKRLIQED